MNAFVQALAELAETAPGLAQVQTLRDTALAKVLAGGGEVTALTSVTINGKAVTQEIRKDAAELFTEASEALRIVGNTAVSVSYPDFSFLTRCNS